MKRQSLLSQFTPKELREVISRLVTEVWGLEERLRVAYAEIAKARKRSG